MVKNIMTTRTLIGSVCFTITGSFLTEHARGLVLSKEPREAKDFLIESLEGMTEDLATKILKGEAMLSGSTSDEEGIFMTEQVQDEEFEYYTKTFKFQNAGILRHNGKYYRPKLHVTSYDINDFQHARKILGDNIYRSHETAKARASYYAYDGMIPSAPSTSYDKREGCVPNNFETNIVVLWELVSDFPSWIKPHKNAQEALDDYLSVCWLSCVGAADNWQTFDEKVAEKIKEFKNDDENMRLIHEIDPHSDIRDQLKYNTYQNDIVQYRKKIEKQAGPIDGDGWIRLPIFNKYMDSAPRDTPDSYLPIPKAPFMIWALQRGIPSKLDVLPSWDCVAPSGMKMYNDSREHSDWVIGAGFDPETFYQEQSNINDCAYAYGIKLAEEILKFEFLPLSKSDKKSVYGTIKYIKPGETLEAGEIGAIPHAGVEYDAALRSAHKHGTALICKVGGRLAHVAIVGRELNVPIIMWEKIDEIFQGTNVTIDLENGKIQIHTI